MNLAKPPNTCEEILILARGIIVKMDREQTSEKAEHMAVSRNNGQNM
jgi:hypothetical protein